jgi:hypothetical protein
VTRFRRWSSRAVLLGAILASHSADPALAAGEHVQLIATSSCASATRDRLDWIVQRLDARERYADLWWKGWLGVYATGAVVQSARAGFRDDRGKRADDIVGAVKAVGGVTRLALSQPTARHGADPLRTETPGSESACRELLAQGENLLRQAADESERRWDWKAHLVNVGINLAGAVVVTEGFDENDGWASAGVGIAVGEAMLWSHPWTGRDDVEDYQAQFATGNTLGPRWAVLPYGRGLRLQVTF